MRESNTHQTSVWIVPKTESGSRDLLDYHCAMPLAKGCMSNAEYCGMDSINMTRAWCLDISIFADVPDHSWTAFLPMGRLAKSHTLCTITDWATCSAVLAYSHFNVGGLEGCFKDNLLINLRPKAEHQMIFSETCDSIPSNLDKMQ